MLSTREVIPVAHERNLAATGCGLDCRKLASIAKMIEAAIQEGADLVVINRFGKLEATGKGLIELIQQAADADIPALIAVPEHRFAGWIKYSAGMSVRLPCRRAALDRWWQSVAMHRPKHRDYTLRACEIISRLASREPAVAAPG
jgi:hypothetical protein